MADNYNNQVFSLLLGNFSVNEIKKKLVDQIVEEFPFSPFGHVLNYLLAETENLPESDRLLNKAAAYSPDRAQLQSILKNSFSSASKHQVKPESAIPSEARSIDVDRSLFQFDFDFKKEDSKHQAEKDIGLERTETKDTLSPYVQWLQSLKPKDPIQPDVDLESLLIDSMQDSDENESTQVAPVIETKQSDFFGEVITETLAEVLADQGQNEKAILMYEKLSLIFPEKSAFFAARIENLKNS